MRRRLRVARLTSVRRCGNDPSNYLGTGIGSRKWSNDYPMRFWHIGGKAPGLS